MPPYRSVRRSGYGRVPRGGGAVRNLARGMGYAWRNRRAIIKAGRSFGKSIRSAWSGGQSVLTQQRDVRSKKPSNKKRPNKRFTRKVENVISQHAGKNTVTFLGPAAGQTNGAGTQNFTFFPLFGANGNLGATSDIFRMLNMHEDPTDLEDADTKNLFFDYGVLTFNITSRATNTTPIFVDIYEFSVRKNMASYASPAALVTDQEVEEEILNDPGTATETFIHLGQVGVTPFQVTNLCKSLKFGRKTSMIVDIGKSATYTLARRKKRWLTGTKVVNSSSFGLEGWTEGILVIFRGAPSVGTAAAASTVDFMSNRKYSWRAMDPDAKNEYLFEVY